MKHIAYCRFSGGLLLASPAWQHKRNASQYGLAARMGLGLSMAIAARTAGIQLPIRKPGWSWQSVSDGQKMITDRLSEWQKLKVAGAQNVTRGKDCKTPTAHMVTRRTGQPRWKPGYERSNGNSTAIAIVTASAAAKTNLAA